jgi:hypothetical protein
MDHHNPDEYEAFDLEEMEKTLKIPDDIKNITPDEAIKYLRLQKSSALRCLLVGESSLDPRDVDSLPDEDLPENVLKEFHPAFTKPDEEIID